MQGTNVRQVLHEYMDGQIREVFGNDNIHFTKENLRRRFPHRYIPDDYRPTDNELWFNYRDNKGCEEYSKKHPRYYSQCA